MERNTVLSPKDVLVSIYDAEPADLQLAITLNPDVERIVQAMKSYAQQFQSPAPLSAATELRLCGDVSREEIEKAVKEILTDDLGITIDYRGQFSDISGIDTATNRIATLLSQRQPVAPEREEEADREKAMRWFHNLPTDEYDYYFEKHYPEKGPMSDEEVEAIWRKEGKPNAPKEEAVGYYFSNEHGNEVTVLSTVGEWCLVSEEGKNKPYVLPLEFVEAIRNESSASAENKGSSADGLSKKGGEG